MILRFSKMHGLGNDFVVINCVTQKVRVDEKLVRFLADRHMGIGCDQVLLVEPPQNPKADFFYRIYNADGSEVAQCGNGARCFARFVLDNKLTAKTTILAETASGLLELVVNDDDTVTVDMGKPRFKPKDIPFDAPEQQATYTIDVEGAPVEISALSIGNPHAVIVSDDIEKAPVEELGAEIEHHVSFPEKVNVGFMDVVSEEEIHLRVWERGVGETRACGSGACAAVVAGQERGLLGKKVTVHLPGGDLLIEWGGNKKSVMMTGPAATVFRGQIKV
jgi:diaminopimelate epimerase